MGRKFSYTTLDRVLSKVYRDLGMEEISETDVIEWAGEALEGIGAISLYEEAVAFAEVKGHHADLPTRLHSIIQIARNNRWIKEEKESCTPAQLIEEVTEESPNVENCGCNTSSILDCNGNSIFGQEINYYRPYYDLQWEYSGWMNTSFFRRKYTPVRLANHSFFNTIVCNEDPELYNSAVDEYTIVGNRLRFSFEEGYVAIAYYRQVLDKETGYPMIPDDYSVITAITMYITMKYMGRMWYMGREGYADKFQKAEQDWQWYCKQAGNSITALYGEDEHEDFMKGRYNLIPNRNKYSGYFGKLGQAGSINFRLRGI